MSDRIFRALVKDADLVVIACVATDTAREARRRHQLATSSAALLGEGLAAGLLLGALQKHERTRVNLQVEGDGPARGFFVDADTQGRVRGYVKVKTLGTSVPAGQRFATSGLVGRGGYVSVLRDIDGEFYRGSVGLEHGDLSQDLEHYFHTSEQVDTTLRTEVITAEDEPLGWVGGVLVQRLPDGDSEALAEIRARLQAGAVAEAVLGGARSAQELVMKLLGEDRLELLADYEASYHCPCSKDRVVRALMTLPAVDVFEMLHEDKQAEANCDFCGEQYVVNAEELQQILDQIDERDARAEQAAAAAQKPPKGPTVH